MFYNDSFMTVLYSIFYFVVVLTQVFLKIQTEKIFPGVNLNMWVVVGFYWDHVKKKAHSKKRINTKIRNKKKRYTNTKTLKIKKWN